MTTALTRESPAPIDPVPLCVDLDGSLIRTDLLWESVAALLRDRPWTLLRLPGWLRAGRATLKQRLAEAASLDVASLPYRSEVLAYLSDQKARGRSLVLATAADAALAEAIAAHLGLFDAVLASDGQHNLKGAGKRAALEARFGVRGFDYLGDSPADLAVWESARSALVVGGTPEFAQAVAQRAPLGPGFPEPSDRGRWRLWRRQLRVHQWSKNLLLFLPLVAGHRLADPRALAAATLGFLAFCAVAAAVYLFNDLVDLPADRVHVRKRGRPLASGRIAIPTALAAAGGLILGAAAIATALPPAFVGLLGVYALGALAYSLRLKRLLIVDVFCLAGLYTVRVLAGGAATGIVISAWLLSFTMFFFLGLALLKRYTELRALPITAAPRASLPGRGYQADDADMVRSLGTASSALAVLVVALYIHDPASAALYRHPDVLLLLCPLLLGWSCRAWMLAHRGAMHVDPVAFALKDRLSLATGLLCAGVVAAATWL